MLQEEDKGDETNHLAHKLKLRSQHTSQYQSQGNQTIHLGILGKEIIAHPRTYCQLSQYRELCLHLRIQGLWVIYNPREQRDNHGY